MERAILPKNDILSATQSGEDSVTGLFVMDTVVFQSTFANPPEWVEGCMASVEQWAQGRGYGYRRLGDELFDSIPPGYRDKVGDRPPILADLARLDLMLDHLQSHGGTALWIDADTLCVDPDWRPDLGTHTGFGEECWIRQDEKKRWRRFVTPHNAFMVFAAASPVLPFLRYLTESIILRADPDRIAPQMVGPKLIKALHSLADFHLYPEAGALSPALIRELVTEPDVAVACYHQSGRRMPAMVNLCASLAGQEIDISCLEQLVREPRRIRALLPSNRPG